ncbi:MAG TPA: hypothetical protein VMV94_04090 [Phycisphaerae bacterium]|nr:hypothetical protein [Phycisphaerae bacterium]
MCGSDVVKVDLTMAQTENEPRRPQGDDEPDVLAGGQVLQRKMVFWRRTAGLLLGLALVVVFVFWQRAELRRKTCADSLAYFGKLAQEAHLADQRDPFLLDNQWQTIDQSPGAEAKSVSPKHYSLILENWGQTPRPGESLPLAVCNHTHLGLFFTGRNVLFHDASGYHVRWLSEEQAAPIVAAARAARPKQ